MKDWKYFLPNLWGELGILTLAWISLMKFYWTLQNARITVFTSSEILRENEKWGRCKIPPTQIRVNKRFHKKQLQLSQKLCYLILTKRTPCDNKTYFSKTNEIIIIQLMTLVYAISKKKLSVLWNHITSHNHLKKDWILLKHVCWSALSLASCLSVTETSGGIIS